MKKKVVIGVAAAVVVIVIAALLVFVFSGKHAGYAPDLSGVWKVATNVTDGVVSIPENEYMVFSEGEASDYRDGITEPYVTSSYKIAGDVLELPDISRTYHIAQQTEEYISLYMNDNTFMTLIKAENETILNDSFASQSVTGKWNITYRPTDKPIVNEYLIFNDGVLSDYRDNAEEPTIEAEYEWNDNIIKAPALGIEMIGARVATNKIILIDINEGYVWLLTKAEG